jgi:hypothetical protein
MTVDGPNSKGKSVTMRATPRNATEMPLGTFGHHDSELEEAIKNERLTPKERAYYTSDQGWDWK